MGIPTPLHKKSKLPVDPKTQAPITALNVEAITCQVVAIDGDQSGKGVELRVKISKAIVDPGIPASTPLTFHRPPKKQGLDQAGVADEEKGADTTDSRGVAESTLHPSNPYHPSNYKSASLYPIVYRRKGNTPQGVTHGQKTKKGSLTLTMATDVTLKTGQIVTGTGIAVGTQVASDVSATTTVVIDRATAKDIPASTTLDFAELGKIA